MRGYLPSAQNHLPALYSGVDEKTFANEREILYQVLFDMKRDMNDLKKLVHDLMDDGADRPEFHSDNAQMIRKIYQQEENPLVPDQKDHRTVHYNSPIHRDDIQDTEEFVEESLSLEDKEIELIKKALDKHKGKRKYAAQELGISERTLYRKIKEYDIN